MVISKHRKTRLAAIGFWLLFIAAVLYLSTYKGEIHELPDSTTHYLTLWLAAALMWIFSAYSLYLALDGATSGKFPGAKSLLPIDCRQYDGVYATLSRVIMFAAALGFVAFPGLLLLLVNGIV